MQHEVNRILGVSTAYHCNPEQIANHTVSMEMFWGPRRIYLSPHEAAEQFKNGKPSIVIGGSGSGGAGAGLSQLTAFPRTLVKQHYSVGPRKDNA